MSLFPTGDIPNSLYVYSWQICPKCTQGFEASAIPLLFRENAFDITSYAAFVFISKLLAFFQYQNVTFLF